MKIKPCLPLVMLFGSLSLATVHNSLAQSILGAQSTSSPGANGWSSQIPTHGLDTGTALAPELGNNAVASIRPGFISLHNPVGTAPINIYTGGSAGFQNTSDDSSSYNSSSSTLGSSSALSSAELALAPVPEPSAKAFYVVAGISMVAWNFSQRRSTGKR